MDEFEKWLEHEAENAMLGSMWDVVDKYRSMTCEMLDGPNGWYKCDKCGLVVPYQLNYCGKCGRKVKNDG